jgi:TolB-like protein
MKFITLLVPLVALTLLSACSSVNEYASDSDENFWQANENNGIESRDNAQQLLIHKSITRLANKLFSNAKKINLSQTVAVGTFLPIHLTNTPNLAEQHFIGLQIQESFITLAAQAGLGVVEFKTSSTIKITEDADIMLSRNIKDLQSDVDAQYFLTGTYSEYGNKLMVNARIIELSNQRVVAAVTDYIAMPSLSNEQKTTIKNNLLYRNAL